MVLTADDRAIIQIRHGDFLRKKGVARFCEVEPRPHGYWSKVVGLPTTDSPDVSRKVCICTHAECKKPSQPQYSPDMQPLDFWFFHEMKKIVHSGTPIKTVRTLKSRIKGAIETMNTEAKYKKMFKDAFVNSLPRRWKAIVDEDGDHFMED